MKLSWGISLLLYASALVALLSSLVEGKAWQQVCLPRDWKSLIPLTGGLIVAGALSVLASMLQLEIASAWPYLIGSAGLFGLLSSLKLSAETCGLILLTVSFAIFSQFSDLTALPLPLLATFLGLAIGKVWNQKAWIDFLLPATWIVGLYWLVSSMPESSLVSQSSLLTVFVAIGLIARSLQSMPLLKKTSPGLGAIYIVITGGLAAWLAVQNLLMQPALMPWVGLFTGGLVLSYLLLTPPDTQNTTNDNAQPPSLLQAGGMALILVGIAALVASRLFGTLGWAVLAVGLLTNCRAGSFVSVAGLFLLGRVLLQVFLTQYNANVTGINITHPYASAALYLGFAIMLLLPGWLNALRGKVSAALNPASANGPSNSDLVQASAGEQIQPEQVQTNFSPLPIITLSLGPILLAGLSNYFLHAEATASLLLALLVAGLGVSFLTAFREAQRRGIPLFLGSFSLAGALASPEVLNWGNEAEKSQKLIVLAVALVLVLLAGFLAQRAVSGRKPVQVS